MNEWISVKDRLPEGEAKRVLCNTHTGYRAVGYYYKGKWMNDDDSKPFSYRVTHWAEIPKPIISDTH